ncbi:hypothetical protein DPMN_066442 [Dreissena polymorpha]|uniref:Uncharacterized protein n=1 Tax=Dreissena polymorpha TaxID=45954 RepID=A0A9D3YTI1_DREPO|nr:hypothetical protein DPMN_066442 [Dreissena polymorpha]
MSGPRKCLLTGLSLYFYLGQCPTSDINITHFLTKFHEDLTSNAFSRLITRFNRSHIHIIARSPDVHVLQTLTILEPRLRKNKFHEVLTRTNILPTFHDDLPIIVASRFLLRLMLTTDYARQTTDKRRSQKLAMLKCFFHRWLFRLPNPTILIRL